MKAKCPKNTHKKVAKPVPKCTKLQEAAVAACRRNCKACDGWCYNLCHEQVGDCMLPNNVAGKNDMCVKVGPSSRPQLQLSYSQLVALYSLLDEDSIQMHPKSAWMQISVHEMIDLFVRFSSPTFLPNCRFVLRVLWLSGRTVDQAALLRIGWLQQRQSAHQRL